MVSFGQAIRKEELFKAPGVAETLDWATALVELDAVALDPARGGLPLRVTREGGFAMSPAAARPDDWRLGCAWVPPRHTIAGSFGPPLVAAPDLGGLYLPDPRAAGAIHMPMTYQLPSVS